MVYLITGTSPSAGAPHGLAKPPVHPALDVSQNHVPFEGRHTARSAMLSPSKSPISGRSPRPPNCRENAVLKPVDESATTYIPGPGRQMAASALPSPSKSPVSGTSPLGPLPNASAPNCDGAKLSDDFSQYHHACCDARHTMMSALPSPSMSASIGLSPSALPPNWTAPNCDGLKPVDDVSHNHCPLDGRHTTISALPSPSISASMGTSPLMPQFTPPTCAGSKPVLDASQDHRPVDGRNVTGSAMPSPSMSAERGMSPAAALPNTMGLNVP